MILAVDQGTTGTTCLVVGDELEVVMPHELWPLATYREMLFIK